MASPPEAAPVKKVKLLSRETWDIWAPPPVNSLKGVLVPRILTRKRRRRRVAIEVHRHEDATTTYDECVVRVLVPVTKEAKRAARKAAGGGGDDGQSVSTNNFDIDDDESTVVAAEYVDDAQHEMDEAGWKAKYKFPIKSLVIKGDYKSTITVSINLGKVTQTRELLFDSTEHALEFQEYLRHQLDQERARAEQKVRSVMGPDAKLPDERLRFLVEISSGWDLPIGDMTSSDPFVACLINGKEVHRTAYISKTLNPVWTIKTGSLFLLDVDPRTLFTSDGLYCHVSDFDKLGKNEKLGIFTIPPKEIYVANGERMEIKLLPPPGTDEEVPGYIAVRIRRATEYDVQFMADLEKSERSSALGATFKGIVDKGTEMKGGGGTLASYLRKQSRTLKPDKHDPTAVPIKQYKVRPGPDPHCPEETTWMSEPDIETEHMKESQEWIDTGSGKLGRLFVEVLGCDNLPNLDTGGRNKTDAFVSLVFQDSMVMTDVVDDCLSPRWLPWTKRGFIFHMMHSSSQLFLGVFDYDEGINPADDHDLVGRVSVDLTNLRKDTVYTLKYNIYTTARMKDRECNGTITIRLRLEIDDERKLLMSTLEPPPELYVNCKKRKDFHVINYTCSGKYDMEKYNLKYINSYVEELLALQHSLFYIQDAVMVLLLWRGTPITDSFKFPVHSLTAFLVMITIVENPQYIPSASFAFFGWLICAVMDYRRGLPDLWSRCKTFTEFAMVLVTGQSPIPHHDIPQHANEKEALEFQEMWKKRIEDTEAAAEKSYKEAQEEQEALEKEMEEIGDTNTDISTKKGGISIDPFKPILFPIQQNLAMVIKYIRHLKYIIYWQECYFSFWIAAICFLLAFMFMFVPWFFLIRWTARIVVWAAFGPWMKLVDMFYVSKMKPPTEAELVAKKAAEKEKRKMATFEAAGKARIKRENAKKLKAMKKYMFGKFIAKVPVLKEDRYQDIPLPSSSAVPYKTRALGLSELAMQEAGYHRTRLPGQHLVGDMIPRVEALGFTEAPVGQATAKPVSPKKGPGGTSPDSTTAAYGKLGALAVAAAVISYFLVPMLSSVADKIIGSSSSGDAEL